MAGVLELVAPLISAETVELLLAYADDAKRGEVVGAAVILLHPGGDYTIDLAGLVRDDPTFTRGMLAKLDDELGKLPFG